MHRVHLVKNRQSPTGYFIVRGDVSVPATAYEISLWHMYIKALDLAVELRGFLEKESTETNTVITSFVAESKVDSSQKEK